MKRSTLKFIAFCLALAAIWQLFQGEGWWAFGLFVAACAVGPGGLTIWRNRSE